MRGKRLCGMHFKLQRKSPSTQSGRASYCANQTIFWTLRWRPAPFLAVSASNSEQFLHARAINNVAGRLNSGLNFARKAVNLRLLTCPSSFLFVHQPRLCSQLFFGPPRSPIFGLSLL